MTTISNYGIRWDPREPYPSELSGDNGPCPWPTGSPRSRYELRAVAAWPRVTKEVSPNPLLRPLPHSAHLAPLAVTVKGQIVSDLAAVSVSQTFENDSDQVTPEAHYTFPLPDDCTVTGFSARVGNAAVLCAKVKPKAEAKQVFKTGVQENRFTALLEEHTTEVFTVSLGNIPARTRIKTEISYTFTLDTVVSADGSVQTFLVPTSIGPRYGHAPIIDVNHSADQPDRFSLELDILDAQNTTVKSRTHHVSVEFHNEIEEAQSFEDLQKTSETSGETANASGKTRVARVRMRDCTTFQHTDLEIKICRNTALRSTEPTAWLEKHPTLKDQYAMMLELPPSVPNTTTSQPSPAGELIFLADRSGSMHPKMGSLRLALRFFLKGIPLGWKFNIWSFGTSYRSLWPQSRAYDAITLAEAMSYLDNGFDANMRGTELLSALRAVVSTKDRTTPTAKARCEVMIITDGEVWHLQETLDFIKSARRSSSYRMRFFALGIGEHVSAALVNGIARCGGGYSEIIPKASDGYIWQGRAVTMLKTALSTPIRHKLTLQLADGCALQAQSPQDLTVASSPFSSQRVFLLYTTAQSGHVAGAITIKVQALDENGQDQQFALSARASPTEPGTLHALAARAFLVDHSSSGKDETGSDLNTIHAHTTALSPQELACRFSLLSQWTSLVLEVERPTQTLSALHVADSIHSRHAVSNILGNGPTWKEYSLYAPRGVPAPQITCPRTQQTQGFVPVPTRRRVFFRSEVPDSKNEIPAMTIASISIESWQDHDQDRGEASEWTYSLQNYAPYIQTRPREEVIQTGARRRVRQSRDDTYSTHVNRNREHRPNTMISHSSESGSATESTYHNISTPAILEVPLGIQSTPSDLPITHDSRNSVTTLPADDLDGDRKVFTPAQTAPQPERAQDKRKDSEQVTRFRGRLLPPLSRSYARRSKNVPPRCPGSPPGFISHTPSLIPPVATKDSTIISIMAAQNFDGSFQPVVTAFIRPNSVQVIAAIQSHILSSCSPEFRPIDSASPSPWSWTLATTLITLLVLQRDFADSEALWGLIDTKGRAYIRTVAEGAGLVIADLFARAEAALEGQKTSGNISKEGDDNSNERGSPGSVSPGDGGSMKADWVELVEAPY